MHVLDAILFVLLLIGNALALPIWWWLFGAPFARLWKWYRSRKRADPSGSRVVRIEQRHYS